MRPPRHLWAKETRRHLFRGLLCIFTSSLSGCASVAVPENLLQGRDYTSLEFFRPADAYDAIRKAAPPELLIQPGSNGSLADRELGVVKECGGDVEPPERFAPPALVFFLGAAIKLIVNLADKKLQEELKNYVAAYQGDKPVDDFYEDVSSTDISLTYSCFRFSRTLAPKIAGEQPTSREVTAEEAASGEVIAMDLVGQIRLVDNQVLQIRPLRLYYKYPKAKGTRFGISVSLLSEAIWLQENVGRHEQVFNYEFLKQNVDLSKNDFFIRYYDDDPPWEWGQWLPLVPWSTNVVAGSSGGKSNFRVVVAEVGNPPFGLRVAAAVLSANKAEIANKLTSAAEGLLAAQTAGE